MSEGVHTAVLLLRPFDGLRRMLSGDLTIGDDIVLNAGDFRLAESGQPHGPIVSKTDALLYIRGELRPAA